MRAGIFIEKQIYYSFVQESVGKSEGLAAFTGQDFPFPSSLFSLVMDSNAWECAEAGLGTLFASNDFFF